MKKKLLVASIQFYTTVLFAQDSLSLNKKSLPPPQTFIYKKDTFLFKRPSLLQSINHVPTNMWKIAKTPFQKKNWIALSAITAVTTILVVKDQEIIHWVRSTSDRIGLKPETDYTVVWKTGNTKMLKSPKNLNTALYQLGEGGTSMMLAGGLWVYGKISKDWRAVNTATDLTETFVTMGLTTQILKRITGRESPFMATTEGGRWTPLPSFSAYQQNTSAYDAFPSGHLATLMATVTVLSTNYPEKKWIKPVGYTLMFLSGWAMLNTEVHWAGDYPLAVAVGYLSGKITTWRHKKKNNTPKEIL
ncbi:MAG: phosphatase PAP2 family protein [Sphingobacteriales bacterium]|nr:phosphatase PAP2 family protein [Sphingobacteriales bacterium]MBI3720461.1 phosphatase PAP2 family protein [Sphingobacteriales bacterium]